MVGQPGVIIALSPLPPPHGYPHFNQAQSPPHQPLQGSTGPEVHPGRKPHCRQAPGSPEERLRGGPTGKSHPRTSGLAVFTPGTQPFQIERDACGRRSTQRSEGATTGACGPGLGVGKPGGRCAGTPAAGTCEQMPTCEQRRRTCRRRAAPPGNARRAPPLPGPRQPPRGADPERPCGLTGQETPG